MLSPEELIKIVQSVFAIGKEAGKPVTSGARSEASKEVPHYYAFYKQCIENVQAIMTHSVKGYFPDRLFIEPSPNQTDVEFSYLKKNYKQTTLPVYIDYISTISRAFHDNNWDIDYTKETEEKKTAEEETFRAYVESELPKYGSLESFIKNILLNAKTMDAMALLCIKPFEVNLREVDDQLVVDDSKKIQPYPVIYACKQVVGCKEGEWYVVELNEKSVVEYGNQKLPIGKIYEIYDDQNIYRAVQVGKYINGTFEISTFYPHNYGKVPARRLEGAPMYIEEVEKLIYFSPFLFATDLLDLALLNDQYLQISINYCTFPYRVMIGDVCNFQDKDGNKCEDGVVFNNDKTNYVRCVQCDGIGLRSRVSRMGTLLLRPATKMQGDGDSQLKADPMKYISPSTETLKFVEDKVAKDMQKARKILHLRDSDSQVQFNKETATGTNSDLKSTYAFVKTVSDQLFSLYDFCLDAIGKMRYGEAYEPVKLTYPKSFDFATEADYLAEINSSISAGLAPAFIQQILMRYIRAMYGDDEQTAKIFGLIVSADRLLTITSTDISAKMGKGTVAGWEEILHTSALTLVQELLRKDAKFFDKDLQKQIDELVALAKEKEAAANVIPASREDLINTLAGGA